MAIEELWRLQLPIWRAEEVVGESDLEHKQDLFLGGGCRAKGMRT